MSPRAWDCCWCGCSCRERRVRIGWKLPAALAGIAAVLLSAALAVEGPAVLGRASKSFGYRLQYWQSSLQMIADHPLGRLRAGQLPGRLHPVQAARGQRGDRRSAQFPVGDLGHGRHARRAGVSGRAGVFCARDQGSGVGGRAEDGRAESGRGTARAHRLQSPNLQISNLQSPIPNP